jgi:hypothetical protein
MMPGQNESGSTSPLEGSTQRERTELRPRPPHVPVHGVTS